MRVCSRAGKRAPIGTSKGKGEGGGSEQKLASEMSWSISERRARRPRTASAPQSKTRSGEEPRSSTLAEKKKFKYKGLMQRYTEERRTVRRHPSPQIRASHVLNEDFFFSPYAGPRGPETPLLLLVVHVLSITLIFSTVYFFRILPCGYTIMNTSIHTTSRLSGRVGVPALYTTAHRAHISHTLSVPHVLAPCAASTTNDTPAPIVSAVSHAARRAPPPRRTTMDKIGTRITTTIAFAHRQRSAPRRATKRQPIHATGASLHYQKSPTLVIRNTPAACKKRKHPKSHGLVSNGRGWPSSDARVGRHPPAAPAAARRLPALTPIAASCARRRLAPVGR